MRKVLRIARRDFVAAVRTKGFLIGLVLFPVLMSGGFLGLAALRMQVDASTKRIAVVDHTGQVVEELAAAAARRNESEIRDAKTGKQTKPIYEIETVAADGQRSEELHLALSDRVRRNELHAFLVIDAGVVHPSRAPTNSGVAYYARNGALDEVRRWLDGPLNAQLRRLRLESAGIDPGAVPDLFDWRPIASLSLVGREQRTGAIRPAERRGEAEAFAAPMAAAILMYMLVIMGALPLLNAVMEEKTQRIAEVLLGSARPFELMLGKVLGGVGVSLTGSLVYLGLSIASLASLGLTGQIPFRVIPWFLGYLVLNNLMFGAIFTAAGALCTDAKDVQNVTLPAMLPTLIPMFVLVPLIERPLSGFSTAMSLVPFFAPTLMVLRLSTPAGVPGWQPWLGLLLVLLCALFCTWVAGRIFRLALLAQGKLPSFTQIVRWAIHG